MRRRLTKKQREVVLEARKQKKKERYEQNKKVLLSRQEKYRYPRSVQKIVDESWSLLHQMDNKELWLWAQENGFKTITSPRRMICFWQAVNRNREEGVQVVKKRYKDFTEFNRNKRTYNM